MSDVALKPRGIEDADTGILLVGALPYPGRVKLTVQVGCQDLDCAGLDHLVDTLLAVRAQSFPDAPPSKWERV